MTDDLKSAFDQLRALLFPLSVEIETDTLDVWRDRETHGLSPLPPAAIRALADWCEKQLTDVL